MSRKTDEQFIDMLKEYLRKVEGKHDGIDPIVPFFRRGNGTGAVDRKKTIELPCYAGLK